MITLRRVASTVAISSLMVLALSGIVAAASAPDAGVVRSYAAEGTVRQGMIVAVSKTDPNAVTPLTNQAVSDMFGVAVSPTDAPITVTGDSGTQVYVATTGQYRVLVSTENGIIHAGDYVSISTLNGVGMKAANSQAVVLGRASADLTSHDIIQNNISVTTDNGKELLSIGSVPVTINIGNNPNAGRANGNLPGFLQVASNSIAAKPVSAPRVYAAVATLLISGVTAAAVLYSGIRGGIVAIGRNPLAKHSIFGAILQAVGAGIGIFVLGLFAVYLLLRL